MTPTAHDLCPFCEIGELYYTGDWDDVDGYYRIYEMRCPECGSKIKDDRELPGREQSTQGDSDQAAEPG